ncbi:MAG: glycosyltransferase family 9 protein [Candidatus Krumholzibacteria bacterium]|nr:glycosyltransferase family 9 protein [Candidatus Krumholzibacteria bacterium]
MQRQDDTILLIRFGSLGDLVLLTALVEALRAGLPGMEIHLVTKERYLPLFERDRRIARVSVLPERGGAGALWRLRNSLSGVRYGILIDAHGVLRSILLSRSLAARRRMRIEKDQIGKAAVLAGRRGGEDIVTMRERYLRLAHRLGVSDPGAMPRLDPGGRERGSAAERFRAAGLEERPVVALAPGARWPAKRWPAERFAELAEILYRAGRGIVLVGGESDREVCAEVAAGVPGALDLCGRFGVMETAAALERADLLVTNDSAPLHLAEAVGTPVVALFGPTVREFGYFPLLESSAAIEADIRCRPCSRNGARPCRFERLECLEAISVRRVAETVEEALSGRKGS